MCVKPEMFEVDHHVLKPSLICVFFLQRLLSAERSLFEK